MIRGATIALLAGVLFGAGLAVSGMADPTRVRAFLDLGGHWDPTLAFVMAGAIGPMAVAWRLRARREAPFVADRFYPPPTRPITVRLVAGSLIFGIGWGIAGLCPGPALADLAFVPANVAPFIVAMITGFGLHRLFDRPFTGRHPRALHPRG